MNVITTRMRITFGLVCLLLSVLLLAMVLGIVPDRYRAVLDGRKALCETVAVNGSVLVTQRDLDRLQMVLRATVERNQRYRFGRFTPSRRETTRRGGRSSRQLDARSGRRLDRYPSAGADPRRPGKMGDD